MAPILWPHNLNVDNLRFKLRTSARFNLNLFNLWNTLYPKLCQNGKSVLDSVNISNRSKKYLKIVEKPETRIKLTAGRVMAINF